MTHEEFEGCVEVLARRITLRHGPECISMEFWQRLCKEFRRRIVVRGDWRLRAAIYWADDMVVREINRTRPV